LAVRARLGLPGDSTVLVNIGSMRGGGKGGMPKAQDVLIRAFARSGLASRALLVLVGDGINRGDLERMCLEMGVRDSVRFTGIVTDPHDFYAAADLVVMPSRVEGLSIAAIEAACAGIPLILSDIEAFELFSGEGVKKCTVESTDSLANAIKDAVEEIDILRRQAEESARLWRERFDIARTAKRYMDIYEMLHDRDPLPPPPVIDTTAALVADTLERGDALHCRIEERSPHTDLLLGGAGSQQSGSALGRSAVPENRSGEGVIHAGRALLS